MEQWTLNADIRQEDGMLWTEVKELPGCFASGETLPELIEALQEAIRMVLEDMPEHPDHIDLQLHLAAVRVAIPA